MKVIEATKKLKRLDAGDYWVGDPCYVLTEELGFDWQAFCRYSFNGDPSGRKNEGMIEHQGIKFAYFGTKWGDGGYNDEDGNLYGVDSGSLACIPMSNISHDNMLGNVHTFPSSFTCGYQSSGTIRFGHIKIRT